MEQLILQPCGRTRVELTTCRGDVVVRSSATKGLQLPVVERAQFPGADQSGVGRKRERESPRFSRFDLTLRPEGRPSRRGIVMCATSGSREQGGQQARCAAAGQQRDSVVNQQRHHARAAAGGLPAQEPLPTQQMGLRLRGTTGLGLAQCCARVVCARAGQRRAMDGGMVGWWGGWKRACLSHGILIPVGPHGLMSPFYGIGGQSPRRARLAQGADFVCRPCCGQTATAPGRVAEANASGPREAADRDQIFGITHSRFCLHHSHAPACGLQKSCVAGPRRRNNRADVDHCGRKVRCLQEDDFRVLSRYAHGSLGTIWVPDCAHASCVPSITGHFQCHEVLPSGAGGTRCD